MTVTGQPALAPEAAADLALQDALEGTSSASPSGQQPPPAATLSGASARSLSVAPSGATRGRDTTPTPINGASSVQPPPPPQPTVIVQAVAEEEEYEGEDEEEEEVDEDAASTSTAATVTRRKEAEKVIAPKLPDINQLAQWRAAAVKHVRAASQSS